jgi:hypothetical protein
MPRPGFYNDNEYRAYPFIYNKPMTLPALPTSAVLDAGFIMGLDAHYDETQHTVWLSAIKKTGSIFEFVFSTDASTETISFTRHDDDGEWALEHGESAADTENECATEPIWSGFLVTGPLDALTAAFTAASSGGVWALQPNDYQIEPSRIQNLNKAYLRSISVGNYARVRVPECDEPSTNDNRPIVVNARCMKGDIRLKEGYNCLITQTDRANELTVTAFKGAGVGETSAELCEYAGELPLFPDETLPLGLVKPTTFVEAFDIHGENPPTATQLLALLPAVCAGNKIGDTYGWKSDLIQLPGDPPPPPYYEAYYYTWNNKTWVRSAKVIFTPLYEEVISGTGEVSIQPTGEFEDFPKDMPPDVQSVLAFFSGGPRCCETISSINGVGGTNVNLIGGAGVNILLDDGQITVQKKPNAQVNCT